MESHPAQSLDAPSVETRLSWSHLDQPEVWSPEVRVSRETALDTILSDPSPRLWRVACVDRNLRPMLAVHREGVALALPSPRWDDDDDMPCSKGRDWIAAWQECQEPETFVRNVAPLCGHGRTILALCAMLRMGLHYVKKDRRRAMRVIEATEAIWCEEPQARVALRDRRATLRSALERLLSVSAQNYGSSAMEIMTGILRLGDSDMQCAEVVNDLRMAFSADASLPDAERDRLMARCADLAREHMPAKALVEGLLRSGAMEPVLP